MSRGQPGLGPEGLFVCKDTKKDKISHAWRLTFAYQLLVFMG